MNQVGSPDEINVEQWKLADKVYANLIDLTVSDALSQLNEMHELDDAVKSKVFTLISNGNQSSQYFSQQISAGFQLDSKEDIHQIGDAVGGYVLQDEIGAGGMAKVYRANKKDASAQKPVAIKVFNHPSSSEMMLDRFGFEQDILSSLSHPNIVNMFHGGRTEQDVPYIVMELIENGTDIDEYSRTNNSTLKQKVNWVLDAAKAIAYAHNNLIIHRDIKPSNILIDENEQLKVVDFGIAKLMGKTGAPQKSTIMALTPTYASPEQVNSGQVSVTTDVFSLASVCLALISEQEPLPGDRLLKSCTGDEVYIWQLLKNHVNDKDLRNILNKALQQDPLKRYRNMDLFAEDLNAWLSDKPVKATPDSWLYRIKKFAHRRSALFATLSTLMVMLVMSIGVFSWQFKKIQTEATKANEVKDFMLGVFSMANPDNALGEKIDAKDLLAQAFEDIKVKSFVDDDIKVELLSAIGLAQSQLGLNKQSAVSYNLAIEIDPDRISSNVGLLQSYIAQGQYELAQQGVESLEQSINESSEHWPLFLMLKSRLANFATDYDQAQSLAVQAELVYQKRNQPRGYLTAARGLAAVMSANSESKQAAVYLEEKLIEAIRYFAPTSPAVLGIQSDLVELYSDQGDYPNAINHAEKLIENISKVFGEKHPFLVEAYMNQTSIYRATGDVEEASKFADMAYELSVEVNGSIHKTTARAKNLTGIMSYVKGDIAMATIQLREALGLFVQSLGSDHPDVWEVKVDLAAMLHISRKLDEAIEILEPTLQNQLMILGKGHDSTLYTHITLSRLYGEKDRLGEAEELAKGAYSNALENLGNTHSTTIDAQFVLADIYQKQKRFDSAIDLLISVEDALTDENERIMPVYNALAKSYLELPDANKATEYMEKNLETTIRLLGKEAPRTAVQIIKTGHHYLAINELKKANQYAAMANQSIKENNINSKRIKDALDNLTKLIEQHD